MAAPLAFGIASPASAAIGCSAEGSICDTEEPNEFVARLKAQSLANKEVYKGESQAADKLSGRQFSSQYDRPKYIGVEKADGTYQMVTPSELDALMKEGKVEKIYQTKVNKKTGEEKIDYSKGESYAFK